MCKMVRYPALMVTSYSSLSEFLLEKQLFLHFFLMIHLFCTGCCAKSSDETTFSHQREGMVKTQIVKRGITSDGVLKAMDSVERHHFVPVKYRSEAYGDHPLPIGYGQTISQPYIVALMTEALAPDTLMTVLEIGTGSGYQAAVLSGLCKKVYSIEIVEPLGRRAQKTLKQLGYSNVEIKIGDGYEGWKEHAPYDAIIVTCAPTEVPMPLVEQLADGGKMVIPVGRKGVQELVLLTKSEGVLVQDTIVPVRFVPMVDSSGSTY